MINIVLHRRANNFLIAVQICLAFLKIFALIENVDAMQALYALLQLFVVIKVIVEHFVHLIFELLLLLFLLSDLRDSISFFLLHALALKFHVPHDQAEIFVYDFEVLGLIVHLSLLLVECLDDFLTWTNFRPKLLDLIIEDEFEFLQLLRLLSVLVNLVLLVLNGAFTLLQLVFHRLDILLLTVGVRDLSVQVLILLVYFLSERIHLLLLVPEFILNERQLTLHFHAMVNVPGQVALILLLDLLDFVPGLVFDTFTLLLVVLQHCLNLFRKSLLLSFFLLALKHLITVAILHQALVSLISLTHELFELLQVFFLLLKETFVALAISRTFLLLILLLLLELVMMFIAAPLELLTVVVAHFAAGNLDLFHTRVALDLLLFHLTRQILHPFLIAGEESGVLLSTVALLCLDRFLQVSDFMLQFVSLLLLDLHDWRADRVVTLITILINDLEDAKGSIIAS